jgi:DNA primase
VVGFELHVDWKQPIVLVEGVFDAIAIRRNAIPLFGKTISDVLKLRLVEKSVKHIYICLDQDARKQALEAAEYFMANGIHVYFVDLPDSDPADLGFQKIHEVIDQTSELSEFKLMEEKILCTL